MSNLLFDPKTVNRQRHVLTKLLRLLFTKLHITEEKFYSLHYEYDLQFQKPADKIQSDRNNLKKILRMDENLTWKKFTHAIIDILRLDLVDVTLTFRDPKTKKTFSLSNRDTVGEDGRYIPAPPLDQPAKPKDA